VTPAHLGLPWKQDERSRPGRPNCAQTWDLICLIKITKQEGASRETSTGKANGENSCCTTGGHSIAITKMQALLLPSRQPPPLLRRGALSAPASLVSTPRHGATLPTGRVCCGGGEGAPRRLTVPAASTSSGPLYPTPPPTEQTIERAKLEQVRY
jgi:hypothetical protein